MIGTEEISMVHERLADSGDGDRLPLVAWTEDAGVDRDEVQPWAIRMARDLFREQLQNDVDDFAEDSELLLLVAIDMFVAGVAIGREMR